MEQSESHEFVSRLALPFCGQYLLACVAAVAAAAAIAAAAAAASAANVCFFLSLALSTFTERCPRLGRRRRWLSRMPRVRCARPLLCFVRPT